MVRWEAAVNAHLETSHKPISMRRSLQHQIPLESRYFFHDSAARVHIPIHDMTQSNRELIGKSQCILRPERISRVHVGFFFKQEFS